MSSENPDIGTVLLKRIVDHAIKLAICRHSLLSDDEPMTSEGEEEIVRDITDCLTGEELGCLDESEKSEETVTLLWVQARIFEHEKKIAAVTAQRCAARICDYCRSEHWGPAKLETLANEKRGQPGQFDQLPPRWMHRQDDSIFPQVAVDCLAAKIHEAEEAAKQPEVW
jgi:hypothetical protein